MSKRKLYWQGEEVRATHCYVEVYPNEEKPLMWYNYECATSGSVNAYTLIEALRVSFRTAGSFTSQTTAESA
jgi:hypothetical protein